MNTTDIQVFENVDFGKVRIIELGGEPWFVGKDVAEILGYSNPQKAIRDHVDEEDRTVNESFTVNGTMITLINESGLYSLILSSKLPKAKEFKHWVTAEVIPSIRKTGRYAAPNVPNMDKLSLTTQCLINLEIANNQLRKDLDGAVQKLDGALQRIEELERSKPMQKGKLVPTTVAPKAWSEREKDYLRKAYALGQTDTEIAADMGRTESSIRSKRKKLGLCGRGGTKWTADEDKKLMKLYEKGLTYNEIGQLIGRSYEGVSNRISKLRRAGRV